MSEYKLSDRIRSGTDIMQRIVGGQRPALIELADEVATLETKLERYERRENGEEFCEAHESWLPIEKMHMDDEGVWLCQEAWDELVASAQKE